MYDIPVYLSWRKSIASNFYIPPTIPVLLEDSHFSWAHVMAHEAEELLLLQTHNPNHNFYSTLGDEKRLSRYLVDLSEIRSFAL